jgi:CMP-N-acetylneuraminic acid synthetase
MLMKNPRVVVFMPMKGNSERVKNKNMKMFDGEPLFHIVLNELQKSKYNLTVVINTDSQELKNDVMINYADIEIVDRPSHLIGDFVPMNKIIEHDIELYDADIYVQTHSTNPLMKYSTIDTAIKTYLDKKETYDSVMSVTRLQTRLYWKNGEPINHKPNELLRTQDLPIIYEENSNFYIFTKESFKNSGGKRIGLKPLLFEIDKIEAIDIDEPIDFTIAEILYKSLRKGTM